MTDLIDGADVLSDAMAGIRVIAVEQAVAAPLCTRHLAEMGADVIKVERPGGGDPARHYDGYVHGLASHFVWLNHGKRSVALDLKSAAGREVLARLLRDADVLVANLGPGALDRIVPDEELAAANPGLIRCVISGYGQVGPYRDRKAYDLLVQGEAGVTLNTGTPGHPAKPGVSLADLASGAYALGAITSALVRRARTGLGGRIEIPMFDAVAEWISPLLLAHRHGGVVPPPTGANHASITPYGPYRSADGVLVNIAVHTDGQWRALCRHVLGAPELAEAPGWASNAERLARRAEVEATVARAVAGLPAVALTAALDRADVPWGVLNDVPEVVTHPQLAARDRWRPVTLPDGTEVDTLAPPFLADAPAGRRPVPAVGEHTLEVLTELGYPPEIISELLASGAAALAGAPA